MKRLIPIFTAGLLCLSATLSATPSITHFNGFSYNGKMYLEWTVVSATDITKMIVERSDDAATFEAIKVIHPDEALLYLFIDDHPLRGTSHYRVKIKGRNGAVVESHPLTFEFEAEEITFDIYPNPGIGDVRVFMPSNCNEDISYTLKGYNSVGQNVFVKKVPKNTVTFEMRELSVLQSDLYTIQLWRNGELKKANRFLKQ